VILLLFFCVVCGLLSVLFGSEVSLVCVLLSDRFGIWFFFEFVL